MWDADLHHNVSFSIPAWCSYSCHLHDVFKNFTFARKILTHCEFRILLEASEIATDLFVIEVSTCKGLVCLLPFLWYVKELWTLDGCITSIMLLSVLSLVTHKTSKSDKMSESISYPFHKVHTPLLLLNKTLVFKKMSGPNEKWYLQLHNLFLIVWCWSRNCNLAWNTLRQWSEHNPTLQFWHLNLIQINTKHHFALWTFISFPGLSLVEHTPHCTFLLFWGQWSLFCIWASCWKGWSSPWGGFWSRHPSIPCNPMD